MILLGPSGVEVCRGLDFVCGLSSFALNLVQNTVNFYNSRGTRDVRSYAACHVGFGSAKALRNTLSVSEGCLFLAGAAGLPYQTKHRNS